MWTVLGGAVLVLLGARPLVSRSFRSRSSGPPPIGFMSNAAVRQGFRRARQWLYLSLVLLGAAGILSVQNGRLWHAITSVVICSWLLCCAVFVVQVSFNWPKWWVPPESHDEVGSVVDWKRRIVGTVRRPRTRATRPARVDPTKATVAAVPPGDSRADPHGLADELSTDEPAVITFSRPGGHVDRLVGYTIWIDGQPVGKLRAKQSMSVEVRAGHHELRASVRSRESALLRLTVGPGGVNVAVRHADPDEQSLLEQAAGNGWWLQMAVESR